MSAVTGEEAILNQLATEPDGGKAVTSDTGTLPIAVSDGSFGVDGMSDAILRPPGR